MYKPFRKEIQYQRKLRENTKPSGKQNTITCPFLSRLSTDRQLTDDVCCVELIEAEAFELIPFKLFLDFSSSTCFCCSLIICLFKFCSKTLFKNKRVGCCCCCEDCCDDCCWGEFAPNKFVVELIKLFIPIFN